LSEESENISGAGSWEATITWHTEFGGPFDNGPSQK